jgi:uncharacterized membrane protein YphA (DoxX/SURF4 family)
MKRPNKRKLPSLLLRIGLAIVFLYAAISSLRQPLLWEGYLPTFLPKSLSLLMEARVLAIYEIALALWLLSGRYAKYAAALTALTFAGIIVVNLNQLIVTFRDFGLLFAAVALYFIDD